MSNHVELGKRYRDTHTGFEGLATGRFEFLYGCVRISLEADKLKDDGQPQEATFDEQRLVSVETNRPVETTATTGGPRTVPQRPAALVRRVDHR